jgi:hypothetical protein
MLLIYVALSMAIGGLVASIQVAFDAGLDMSDEWAQYMLLFMLC